ETRSMPRSGEGEFSRHEDMLRPAAKHGTLDPPRQPSNRFSTGFPVFRGALESLREVGLIALRHCRLVGLG
ncbi:MAG: hypothetical protein ACYSTY_14700, partial [Planctomycetota bacterium]